MSLYIPPSKDGQDVHSRLQSEIAEAQNIKSDTTRKRVISALQLAQREIVDVKDIPPTGMVVFAGEVNGGTQTIVKTIIDDDVLIDSYRYICDTTFHTEHIDLVGDPVAIVLGLELGNVIIGTMGENTIVYEDTVTQRIPRKHSKGGQSQQRFARRRDEAVKGFYSVVGDRLSDFSGVDTLIIGGPGITVDNFKSSGHIPHWFDSVITLPVQVSGEETLSRIVESLDETVIESDSQSEYFFEQLRGGLAVYGSDHVAKAVEYNAVEKLYVLSEDISDGVIEATEQQGGEVIHHSVMTETDERLDMMTDVAATLRYDIGL